MPTSKQQHNKGNSNWAWWAGCLFLLLAYCNHAEEHEGNGSGIAGLTPSQAMAYRDCVKSSGAYNLSDGAQSQLCQDSAQGRLSAPSCHTEWDGRSNSTICD